MPDDDTKPVEGTPEAQPPNEEDMGQVFMVGENPKTLKEILDENAQAAEKGRGADARFREASEMRTNASRLELLEGVVRDVASSQKQDYAAMRRLAQNPELGMNPQNVEGMIQAMENPEQAIADATEDPAQAAAAVASAPRPITLDDLDPALRQELEASKALRHQAIRGQTTGALNQTLDSDPILSQILSSKHLPAGAQQRLRDHADGELRRRVREQNRPPDAAMFSAVVQDTRQFATDVGMLVGGDPGTGTPALPATPGLGPAPAGGPSSVFHRAKEPPKRVSGREPGARSNLAERILFEGDKLAAQEEAE